MDLSIFFAFFSWLNKTVLALPSSILFLGVAIFLTLKTRFIQIRAFPRFLSLIFYGISYKTKLARESSTMNSFHALFTAMATTIGMGNVVGPSVAIMSGGPGALFWLLLYIFFGAVTKFAEVTFALHTRVNIDGRIVGGPMEYLKVVHPALALWYTSIIIFLFMSWSSVQSNTLAHIFAQEQIPHWCIGVILGLLVLVVLHGGAKRVGALASKLVPLMFVLYVGFGLLILCKNPAGIVAAIKLIGAHIFSPAAAWGGFMGATVFQAIRHGVYRGILITEAGVGTASIPHAVADTENPVDQGILAMCSTIADAFLSALSGLLVLITGAWATGNLRTTLIYEVFRDQSPFFGRFILLFAISLFVITTVIGNSFNGVQSFSSLTGNRWIRGYILCTVAAIIVGSMVSMPLIWEVMDTLLTLVAIPNLIGVVLLSISKPQWLRDR